jgi:pimeloyl-ACP methyl ester carboxylesterase
LPRRGSTFVRDLPGPTGAPTVVLLHGLGGTADLNWFPSYWPLSRRFRVVAIDHRGHGQGIRSGRAFRLSDCADDVAVMADVLGIDRFVPVGYSMGGPIAQLLWKRHRDRVEGLVLCATSRNFRGRPAEQAMFALLPGLSMAARVAPRIARRRVADQLFGATPDSSPLEQWAMAELRQNDPARVMEGAASLGRFNSRDWIGGVDVPTAVVVTTEDGLVPPHRQLKLAESIPHATVHPVRGDHSVCVTRPDLFVPALLEACRAVTVAAPVRPR